MMCVCESVLALSRQRGSLVRFTALRFALLAAVSALMPRTRSQGDFLAYAFQSVDVFKLAGSTYQQIYSGDRLHLQPRVHGVLIRLVGVQCPRRTTSTPECAPSLTA
jgi:hypothetical protein